MERSELQQEPSDQSYGQSAGTEAESTTPAQSSSSVVLRTALLLLTVIGILAWMQWKSQPPATAVPPLPPANASEDVSELLQQLHTSVVRAADVGDTWGDYGMALMQHEFYSEALQCLAVAEFLAVEDPRWPYLQGVILEQSSAAQALSAFQRTLRARPGSVPTILRSISAQISLGHYEEATVLVRQLLKKQPEQQQGWLLLFQLHRLQHLPERPADLVARAREARADTRELLQEAARLALQQEDFDGAMTFSSAAEQANSVSQISDPWMDLVRTYDASGTISAIEADQLRIRGEQDAAAEKLAGLVRAQPDRSRPALNLALSLQEAGRVEAAEEQLADLSRRFPEDPLIRFHYAVLLSQTARPQPALTQLQRCLQLKPDYGLARSLQALLLSHDGQAETATVEFRRAVQYTPASIPIRIMFLEFLQQQSRVMEFEQLLLDSAPLFLSDAADADPALQSYRQQLRALQSSATAERHKSDAATEQNNE